MGTHVLILTVVVIGLLICSLRDSRKISRLQKKLAQFEIQVARNEGRLLSAIVDVRAMVRADKARQMDSGEEKGE